MCQIRKILSNPIYIGKPTFAGNEVDAPQLAMILPPERFHMVQAMLAEKAAKRGVKKVRKPRSILDGWARRFGTDYEVRVLDELKPICPRCRKIKVGEDGSRIITGPIMVGNGSKIVRGVRVPRFMCPSCGHQRTIPPGNRIECFQGADLLICPNSKCRAVENFELRQLVDGSYEYTCQDCGLAFRIGIPPEKSARRLPNSGEGKRKKDIKKSKDSAVSPKRGGRKRMGHTGSEKIDPSKFKTLDEFGLFDDV